jgi:hypothetical protein
MAARDRPSYACLPSPSLARSVRLMPYRDQQPRPMPAQSSWCSCSHRPGLVRFAHTVRARCDWLTPRPGLVRSAHTVRAWCDRLAPSRSGPRLGPVLRRAHRVARLTQTGPIRE